jgi:hypothetical protein
MITISDEGWQEVRSKPNDKGYLDDCLSTVEDQLYIDLLVVLIPSLALKDILSSEHKTTDDYTWDVSHISGASTGGWLIRLSFCSSTYTDHSACRSSDTA